MDPTLRRIYQVLLLGSIAVLFFVIAFSTPAILDSTDFSIYNSGWNGCSQIALKTYETGRLQPTFSFEGTDLTLTQHSFSDYQVMANASTIVIIGPRTSFSSQEISYLQSFLEDGGMVLLADDFGTGTQLLRGINSSIIFSHELLSDFSFEKTPRFVTVFDIANETKENPIMHNVSRLLLNYPTSLTLKNKKNLSVLAWSSELSWLDSNENDKKESNEEQGPFPLLAVEHIGDGTLVVFAGPSALINSMQDIFNNQQFRENLFSYIYSGRSSILLDESHRDFGAPLQVFYQFSSTISLEVKIGILLCIIGVYLVFFTALPRIIITKMLQFIRRQPSSKESLSDEKLIDEVLKDHPKWSRTKLEYLMKRLKS